MKKPFNPRADPLAEKHEAERKHAASLRRVKAWEQTDAGKQALAISAEFSAMWRSQWTAIEHAKKTLKRTGKLILIVTGGRDFCETHNVAGQEIAGKTVDLAMDERRALAVALDLLNPTCVIQGGAHGADRWAKIWADKRGVDCVTEMADWTTYGHRAGPMRNQRMIDTYKPDAGVAFSGNGGTKDCTDRMIKAGVEVYRVTVI